MHLPLHAEKRSSDGGGIPQSGTVDGEEISSENRDTFFGFGVDLMPIQRDI